jgi:hypothetical protein
MAVPVPDPARQFLHEGADDSEVPSTLRLSNDILAGPPLVRVGSGRVGDGHFVARHRWGQVLIAAPEAIE